ncbi:MAG: c-type cytochrome [Vicinamibacterales bacterium]
MTSTRAFRGYRIAAVAGLSLAGLLVLAARVDAQTGSGMTGDYLFRTYCAACHGTSAKGDGPLADSMRRRPADLTEIAKRNKGVFPADDVYRIIDGKQPVKGHGGPDMPVWGDVFARSEGGADPNVVQSRIKALVTYLQGIQAKTAN